MHNRNSQNNSADWERITLESADLISLSCRIADVISRNELAANKNRNTGTRNTGVGDGFTRSELCALTSHLRSVKISEDQKLRQRGFR